MKTVVMTCCVFCSLSSSWPFSVSDSIQPVALLVKRPFIALVITFVLFSVIRTPFHTSCDGCGCQVFLQSELEPIVLTFNFIYLCAAHKPHWYEAVQSKKRWLNDCQSAEFVSDFPDLFSSKFSSEHLQESLCVNVAHWRDIYRHIDNKWLTVQ